MRNHGLRLPIVSAAVVVLLTALVDALPAQTTSADLLVDVPEDATIHINGYLTRSTGPQRHYRARNMMPREEYVYTIVASVVRNGRQRFKTEEVILSAGRTVEVSLPEPYVQPHATRFVGAGVSGPDRGVGSNPRRRPELLPVPPVANPADDLATYFAVTLDDVWFDVEVPREVLAAVAKPKSAGLSMWPCVVLDGQREAYLEVKGRGVADTRIVARSAEPGNATGRLLLAAPDGQLVRMSFVLPADSARKEARSVFYRTRLTHYRRLLDSGATGAAWFRHQIRCCETALHGADRSRWSQAPSSGEPSPTDLMNWFELLTGGRALSENLWLDRQLENIRNEQATVDIDALPGIEVRPFDWTRLVANLEPRLDVLAAKIPADQHAVFFPSVDAAARLARQAAGRETVVLQLAKPRSEHMRIQERYEKQLGLSLDRLAEVLRSGGARSLALTGSDPHVSMGTDVALLVESAEATVLAQSLLDEIRVPAPGGQPVTRVQDSVGRLVYRGVRTADRRASSYVAVLDEQTVVLTNSPNQLRRLTEVQEGAARPLAGEPEYAWFRDRYRLGDPKETALLVISDAAIRRWGGPRCRIGQARRIFNAAALAEAQAILLDADCDRLDHADADRAPSLPNLPDGFAIGEDGAYSTRYGSLEFMTPVADVPLKFVSQAEADAYKRWRTSYEQNWVRFDPIALRIEVDPTRMAADLTITPLTLRSDYVHIRSLTQGASIAPGAGDPHDALLHVAVAFDKDSPLVKMYMAFAAMAMQGTYHNALDNNTIDNALDWLGETVSVYLDDDPAWGELPEVIRGQRAKSSPGLWGLLPIALQTPLGVQIEVTSGLELTKFLAGVRAFLEETAPGMLKWELRTYRDQPYARVSLSEMAQRDVPVAEADAAAQFGIYYTTAGEALVISLRESVLQRAIDRQIARRTAKASGTNPPPPAFTWQGNHVAAHVEQRLLEVLSDVCADEYRPAMQKIAWGNLPILNELKQRHPDDDPLKLYERLWGTRLVCPGGGSYVWNDRWQSFESTVYGHPGDPKPGPAVPPQLEAFRSGDFGLTFENQGLRAQISLEREHELLPQSE